MDNKEYKCCGDCCWFYAEDTYGYGGCTNEFGEIKQCGHKACEKYTSKQSMRHYLAVLLQANRYRRDQHVPAWHKMPNPTELGKAIDFAYKYIKTFSNL